MEHVLAPLIDVNSAENKTAISLNLSAIAEENIGSAVAELETKETDLLDKGLTQGSSEKDDIEQDNRPPLPTASATSMQDYYQLQENLLKLTLSFTVLVFIAVCTTYPLEIALSYVVGAVTGIVYFRMLGKSVGRLGRETPLPSKGSSNGRFAVFIGVMVVATQWHQISVLPVFLGFLTYKAALIAFVIWTAIMPAQKTA